MAYLLEAMFNLRDILRSATLLSLGAFVGRAGAFAFKYIAMVVLSVEDYGKFSLVMSLFLSLSVVASFGIATALSKVAADEAGDGDRTELLYRNAVALTTITGLVAWSIFIVLLHLSIGESGSLLMIVVYGAAFMSLGYYHVSIGMNLGRLRFGVAAFYEAGESLAKLVLIAIAWIAFAELTSTRFLLVFCLSYSLLGVIAFLNRGKWGFHAHGEKGFSRLDKTIWGVVLRQSCMLSSISFVNIFYAFLLRYYLSLSSIYEVAIFDFALVLYSIPRMIFGAIVRPIIPYAANSREEKVRIPDIWYSLMIFFIGIVVVFVSYTSGITGTVFGFMGIGAYEKSMPLFMLLCCGAIFDFSFGYLSSYLQGMGRITDVFKITMLVGLIAMGGSYYLVRHFGVYGCVLAYISYFVALATVCWLHVARVFGFDRL